MTLHSISDVGDFIIVKTDNGEYTRRQWARTTVGQIVQIDPDATPERTSQILTLKKNMVEAIEPFFGTSIDVNLVFNKLLQVTENSPWRETFQYPAIKTRIF